MANARSKISDDGKLPVPAEILEKIGGPGAVIEFIQDGDQVILRRGKAMTFEEFRKRIFPDGPPEPRTVEEMDDGIRRHLRKKHARR
ncbi:MAG TPA: AbrB/MazE/SpoVT family DNA-binding domain-containing protein [Thermoanaerobaculia bacterium]|jgi:bifunctional DNA-binding transcriptional regulator/antitoxin component of YhaV-PrlF toxin-antitoxin module